MKDETIQPLRPLGRPGSRPPKPVLNRLGVMLARVLVWGVAAAAVFLLLAAGWRSLKKVFVTENPHFTLRHITPVVNGQLSDASIRIALVRAGVRTGRTNLYALDLEKLRRDLTGNLVTIADAKFHRKLPDTLVVEVTERVPKAQLGGGGLLLDADGWILPARYDEPTRTLPVIFGVRSRIQKPGGRTTDEMLVTALNYLRLSAIRPYGRLWETKAIILQPEKKRLMVILRAKGTFTEGSRLLLPAGDPYDLDSALDRAGEIAFDRNRAGQPTSFIDATYQRHVPVMP